MSHNPQFSESITIHNKERKMWIGRFHNMEALLSEVDSDENRHPESVDSSRREGSSFTATDTWEDSLKIAREGWAEGVEMASEATADINAALQTESTIYEPFMDVCGGAFDMGAYLDGRPECMINFRQTVTEETNGVLRIYVNTIASGGISKTALMRKGAAIIALIQALEKAGRDVEVYAGWFNGGKPYGNPENVCHFAEVAIKRAGESIDISNIAYAVGHPAFMRRQLFALIERVPDAPSMGATSYGYGTVAKVPAELRADYDIVIDGMMLRDGYDWVANAKRWVLSQLKAQGIELEEN